VAGQAVRRGCLWRGDAAAEAKKFRARYKGPLSDVERGFLDAVIHHEAAQARRRRTAMVTGFATLSMIVVATMVLLVIVQRSRVAARDNAAKAHAAQRMAEQRLDEATKANAAREAAEVARRVAITQTESSRAKRES